MKALYLTQVNLDYAIAIKRRIRDAYDWHQMVWMAFPERGEADRDFLTRLDRCDGKDRFRLLILSETRPARPDWCPEPGWRTKEVSPAFLDHDSYAFSLLANPTKKERVEGRKNGRRVPLVSREERLGWLQRKAEGAGFRFNPEQTGTIPGPRERFCQGKGGHRGTLSAVDFRGVLHVTDRAAFRDAFRRGIGPAKAFGFGMLCLAPNL